MQLRKVAAGALGALMAGMSLAGAALAADYTLSDFPAPFVENGTPNFLIVVGSGGSAAGIASDIAGSLNIAARLGGETVTTEGGEGETTVTGESKKIESPGEDLNYGEDFEDVDATLDKTDLPTLFADGTYKESKGDEENDVTYTQKITFTDLGNQIVFETNDKADNEPTDTFLKLTDGTAAYTYTLKFDNPVKFTEDDNKVDDDFKMTDITILGTTYTVTDAKTDGADHIDELVLMGGAAEATGNDETPTTVTLDGVDYTVTPSIYDTDSATLTIEYDGTTETTDEMDEGDTYELANGVEVGIQDILYSTKESKTSAATFYVGAQKLTLKDGEKVELNDDEIDGSLVDLGDDTVNELNYIKITYTPKKDAYIGVGEEWTDPVFGKFKFLFTGLTKSTEEIKATTTTDDGKLKLTNIAGDELEIPFVDDDTNVYPGNDVIDSTSYWYVQEGDGGYGTASGNLLMMDDDYCAYANSTTAGDLETACTNALLLVVGTGGEARIIEITDLDATNDEVNLEDLTTGKTWSDQKYTSPIDLGFATITLTEETGDYDGLGGSDDIRLKYADGGLTGAASTFKTSLNGEIDIDLDAGVNDVTVEIIDDDGNEGGQFEFDVDTDGDMIITDLTPTMSDKEEDSDTQVGLDTQNWGTIFEYDSEDKNDLTITYPEEKVIANVYVASTDATTATTTGEVTRTGVIKTPISAVDSQVTETQKANENLILVGGPCVNKLTADALGLTYPACGMATVESLGIPSDGYMIKLVKNAFAEGKYALVVFGVEAKDTTAACAKVQADMADMTGTEYIYPAPLETTTTTIEGE